MSYAIHPTSFRLKYSSKLWGYSAISIFDKYCYKTIKYQLILNKFLPRLLFLFGLIAIKFKIFFAEALNLYAVVFKLKRDGSTRVKKKLIKRIRGYKPFSYRWWDFFNKQTNFFYNYDYSVEDDEFAFFNLEFSDAKNWYFLKLFKKLIFKKVKNKLFHFKEFKKKLIKKKINFIDDNNSNKLKKKKFNFFLRERTNFFLLETNINRFLANFKISKYYKLIGINAINVDNKEGSSLFLTRNLSNISYVNSNDYSLKFLKDFTKIFFFNNPKIVYFNYLFKIFNKIKKLFFLKNYFRFFWKFSFLNFLKIKPTIIKKALGYKYAKKTINFFLKKNNSKNTSLSLNFINNYFLLKKKKIKKFFKKKVKYNKKKTIQVFINKKKRRKKIKNIKLTRLFYKLRKKRRRLLWIRRKRIYFFRSNRKILLKRWKKKWPSKNFTHLKIFAEKFSKKVPRLVLKNFFYLNFLSTVLSSYNSKKIVFSFKKLNYFFKNFKKKYNLFAFFLFNNKIPTNKWQKKFLKILFWKKLKSTKRASYYFFNHKIKKNNKTIKNYSKRKNVIIVPPRKLKNAIFSFSKFKKFISLGVLDNNKNFLRKNLISARRKIVSILTKCLIKKKNFKVISYNFKKLTNKIIFLKREYLQYFYFYSSIFYYNNFSFNALDFTNRRLKFFNNSNFKKSNSSNNFLTFFEKNNIENKLCLSFLNFYADLLNSTENISLKKNILNKFLINSFLKKKYVLCLKKKYKALKFLFFKRKYKKKKSFKNVFGQKKKNSFRFCRRRSSGRSLVAVFDKKKLPLRTFTKKILRFFLYRGINTYKSKRYFGRRRHNFRNKKFLYNYYNKKTAFWRRGVFLSRQILATQRVLKKNLIKALKIGATINKTSAWRYHNLKSIFRFYKKFKLLSFNSKEKLLKTFKLKALRKRINSISFLKWSRYLNRIKKHNRRYNWRRYHPNNKWRNYHYQTANRYSPNNILRRFVDYNNRKRWKNNYKKLYEYRRRKRMLNSYYYHPTSVDFSVSWKKKYLLDILKKQKKTLLACKNKKFDNTKKKKQLLLLKKNKRLKKKRKFGKASFKKFCNKSIKNFRQQRKLIIFNNGKNKRKKLVKKIFLKLRKTVAKLKFKLNKLRIKKFKNNNNLISQKIKIKKKLNFFNKFYLLTKNKNYNLKKKIFTLNKKRKIKFPLLKKQIVLTTFHSNNIFNKKRFVFRKLKAKKKKIKYTKYKSFRNFTKISNKKKLFYISKQLINISCKKLKPVKFFKKTNPLVKKLLLIKKKKTASASIILTTTPKKQPTRRIAKKKLINKFVSLLKNKKKYLPVSTIMPTTSVKQPKQHVNKEKSLNDFITLFNETADYWKKKKQSSQNTSVKQQQYDDRSAKSKKEYYGKRTSVKQPTQHINEEKSGDDFIALFNETADYWKKKKQSSQNTSVKQQQYDDRSAKSKKKGHYGKKIKNNIYSNQKKKNFNKKKNNITKKFLIKNKWQEYKTTLWRKSNWRQKARRYRRLGFFRSKTPGAIWFKKKVKSKPGHTLYRRTYSLKKKIKVNKLITKKLTRPAAVSTRNKRFFGFLNKRLTYLKKKKLIFLSKKLNYLKRKGKLLFYFRMLLLKKKSKLLNLGKKKINLKEKRFFFIKKKRTILKKKLNALLKKKLYFLKKKLNFEIKFKLLKRKIFFFKKKQKKKKFGINKKDIINFVPRKRLYRKSGVWRRRYYNRYRFFFKPSYSRKKLFLRFYRKNSLKSTIDSNNKKIFFALSTARREAHRINFFLKKKNSLVIFKKLRKIFNKKNFSKNLRFLKIRKERANRFKKIFFNRLKAIRLFRRKQVLSGIKKKINKKLKISNKFLKIKRWNRRFFRKILYKRICKLAFSKFNLFYKKKNYFSKSLAKKILNDRIFLPKILNTTKTLHSLKKKVKVRSNKKINKLNLKFSNSIIRLTKNNNSNHSSGKENLYNSRFIISRIKKRYNLKKNKLSFIKRYAHILRLKKINNLFSNQLSFNKNNRLFKKLNTIFFFKSAKKTFFLNKKKLKNTFNNKIGRRRSLLRALLLANTKKFFFKNKKILKNSIFSKLINKKTKLFFNFQLPKNLIFSYRKKLRLNFINNKFASGRTRFMLREELYYRWLFFKLNYRKLWFLNSSLDNFRTSLAYQLIPNKKVRSFNLFPFTLKTSKRTKKKLNAEFYISKYLEKKFNVKNFFFYFFLKKKQILIFKLFLLLVNSTKLLTNLFFLKNDLFNFFFREKYKSFSTKIILNNNKMQTINTTNISAINYFNAKINKIKKNKIFNSYFTSKLNSQLKNLKYHFKIIVKKKILDSSFIKKETQSKKNRLYSFFDKKITLFNVLSVTRFNKIKFLKKKSKKKFRKYKQFSKLKFLKIKKLSPIFKFSLNLVKRFNNTIKTSQKYILKKLLEKKKLFITKLGFIRKKKAQRKLILKFYYIFKCFEFIFNSFLKNLLGISTRVYLTNVLKILPSKITVSRLRMHQIFLLTTHFRRKNNKKLRVFYYNFFNLYFYSIYFKNLILFLNFINNYFKTIRDQRRMVGLIKNLLPRCKITDLDKSIIGLKFLLTGKINKRPRSRTLVVLFHRISGTQSLDIKIYYAAKQLFNRFGAFGAKLWLYTF